MPHPDSTPRLPRAAPPSPAAPAPRAPADSEDARGHAPGNAVPEEDIEPADATADDPHPAQAGRAASGTGGIARVARVLRRLG
ncbi:hypothetical protein [Achromobacter xylosoxidans]|uniref:hypothetical protein n=1 Tax=Alcaligenes xylosoxydans xylosoxydans TaxID=85698 RepID=UPI001EEC146F|nr:hypothetical protein [Achromobacter xylosoxidans]